MKFHRYYLVLIIISIAVASAAAFLFIFNKPTSKLKIETSTVSQGGTMTISQHYRNRWSAKMEREGITIQNSEGKNVLFRKSRIENVTEVENQASGFIEFGDYYDLLRSANRPETKNYYPSDYSIRQLGCTFVDWRGAAKVPTESTQTQSFHVFPNTPPGEYKVIISSSYYCEGEDGPTGILTFRVQ